MEPFEIEQGPHWGRFYDKLVAEASTIGFPVNPYSWPQEVSYEGVVFNRIGFDLDQGEVVSADYMQGAGLVLQVWND